MAPLILALILMIAITTGGLMSAQPAAQPRPTTAASTDSAGTGAQPERPQRQPRRRGQGVEIPEHAVEITTDDTWRRIEANGIPEHDTGTFPSRNNPNAISGQSYDYRVPANPEQADELTPVERQPFGVAVNGVPFDPGTAENFKNDPATGWRLEGFNSVFNLGLDDSNAHVQPNGAYHYHGVPTALLNNIKTTEDGLEMVLLGYAADGFPIYNAVAQSVTDDGKTELKELTPSYRLLQGERRDGTDDDNTPPGEYNGDFTRDWEFDETHGDLDEANGTFGPTPEHPDGTYYYCVTEAFPYLPRFFTGTPDASFNRREPRDGRPRGPQGNNRERPQPRGLRGG